MLQGLIYGVLAMMFYGFAFAMPVVVPTFSSLEVALGRFLVYGLVSLGLLTKAWLQKDHAFPFRYWKEAIGFALTGYIVYYFLLVVGLRLLGAPLGTLIHGGLLPVAVSLYGNMRQREFPPSVLIPPLTLIFFGMGIVHIEDLHFDQEASLLKNSLGLIAILCSVAMWSWFSVMNGHFLSQHKKEVEPSHWSTLIGVFCLFASFIILAGILIWNPEDLRLRDADITSEEVTRYVIASLILGIGPSWLSTLFWNKASTFVSMAILGQLIVIETLAGLLYIFIIQMQLPSTPQIIGITCISLGLIFSFRRIQAVKPRV